MREIEKTAYSRAYTRRRSLELLAAVLAANFEAAVMLTFRYSGAAIPPAVVASQIRWLKALAKRIAGGPFRYVQTTTYDFAAGGQNPVFRLIVQLPGSVCEEVAANWFMGPAAAEAVTAEELAEFVSGLMDQPPDVWPEHCATWSCSADLRLNRLYAGTCRENLKLG